ncbi:hypothetical protein [Fodinibius sediminis]|uniref:DUF5673 domain-containing protein n=1 Tax=Fodinibius sediminis TaxID=1214077 RepID=A0A521BXU3_9BACT|nr:hypothetical protein [Fodinibius sediminis]SMO51280.1 hypothetical protein SAMN06265218_10468 [Fodinibius sediminis]
MVETDLHIIYWFILGTFTLAAVFLASSTLLNVVRLRNIRLSWKTGKIKGYPLFATLFLAVTLAAGSLALYRGTTTEMVAAGLYSWMGFCWFTTSFFASKRFITDHGIVKNVNEPSQTVAWHQIRDFVEKETDEHMHYIFIYSADAYDENSELIRLELQVPHKRRQAFQNLVAHKLGHRIRCYVKDDDTINVEQFK